jgi:hypothetical protein
MAVRVKETRYDIDCFALRDMAAVLDAAVKHSNREIVRCKTFTLPTCMLEQYDDNLIDSTSICAQVSIDRPTVPYGRDTQCRRAWWRYAIQCAQDEVREPERLSRTFCMKHMCGNYGFLAMYPDNVLLSGSSSSRLPKSSPSCCMYQKSKTVSAYCACILCFFCRAILQQQSVCFFIA